MKKLVCFFVTVSFISLCNAQKEKEINLQVLDLNFNTPIKAAYVYNYNKTAYYFTDNSGQTRIKVSLNDTLLITKTSYKQKFLIITDDLFNHNNIEVLMANKAFLLSEIRVFALNPSYEKFKRNVVNMETPYMKIEGIQITEQDKINAEVSNSQPSVLRNTSLGSPISLFYSMFSRKEKMNRLYADLMSNEEEAYRVPQKYNQDIVSKVTGLTGDEVLNFMMYCRFSYYDIARWTDTEIITAIREKYYCYVFGKKR